MGATTAFTDLPETLPVFPLTGALLLPRGQLPLNVFEPRYLEMVDDALQGDRLIGMIQPTEKRGYGAAARAVAGGLRRHASSRGARPKTTAT